MPVLEPQSDAEKRYNVAHRKCRHPVERCIGVFKSRFRCLCRQRILMYSPKMAGTIINACAVLHNMLLYAKYPLPPEDEIEDNMDDDDGHDEVQQLLEKDIQIAGTRARDQVIRQYFG